MISKDDVSTGSLYVNRGAFISGVTLFDHQRFGILATEAQLMNVQQRITLEVAYEALVDAGLEVGFGQRQFIGTFVAEISSGPGSELAVMSPYTVTGNSSIHYSQSIGIYLWIQWSINEYRYSLFFCIGGN